MSSRTKMTGTARLFSATVLVAGAALPLFSGNPFHLHLAILVCLNTVFVAGLGLIARVGQLSLCHGAFVGIGAYAGVLLEMGLGVPFALELPVAALLAALIAALLGWVILRLRGVYFTLVTFAFGEVVRLVLLDWTSLFGGANGLAGIPAARLGAWVLDNKSSFYLFTLTAAALVLAFSAALVRSPVGRAFDAVAESRVLAEAIGINSVRFQMLAFILGSAMAGAGGVLLAHYLSYISPESFGFSLSVTLITMLVVGGRTAVLGSFWGALFLTPLPELLRNALELQHVLYGLALILVLRLLPRGIGGLLEPRPALLESQSDADSHGAA
jgi:branched-chain amino acid transport system permease protein